MQEVKQDGPGGGPVCRTLDACSPSGAGPKEKVPVRCRCGVLACVGGSGCKCAYGSASWSGPSAMGRCLWR